MVQCRAACEAAAGQGPAPRPLTKRHFFSNAGQFSSTVMESSALVCWCGAAIRKRLPCLAEG
jgi:hypothetical protein